MVDLYKTIQSPEQGLYKEKGSKFISFAYSLKDEQSIKEQIEDLQKRYHNASHHCYAWRLGAEMNRYRVNDDGEPSGSAGKPIFGQIQSRKLTDIVVVVIRYFGGTLLGVGGLINAYRSAAADALDRSTIIELKVYDRMKLEFEYTQMNSVMKIVKEFGLDSEDQIFDLDCTLTLKVWKRYKDRITDKFTIIDGVKFSEIE